MVEVKWELIGPPVVMVHRVIAENDSYSLYALQYRWRHIPEEFWISDDGGNSWSRVAKVPPGPGQIDDSLRETVAQAVIPREFRSVKAIDMVAQECGTLFANVSVILEDTQQLFLLQNGQTQELTPPEPLGLVTVSWLAILCSHKEIFLYLVNDGKLWRTTLSSPP